MHMPRLAQLDIRHAVLIAKAELQRSKLVEFSAVQAQSLADGLEGKRPLA